MTQRQIPHNPALPSCACGHSARHIVDKRAARAGGGHFIECRCRQTARYPDAASALLAWRRMNRGLRAAAKTPATNVLQFPLSLGGPRNG